MVLAFVNRKGGGILTIKDTLEIEVGLSGSQFGTDELVIDFILDIGQKNEGSDDTGVAGRLQLGGNFSVPDVVVVGDEGSHGVLGHGQEQLTVVDESLSARDPVRLGGVS